LIVVSISIIVDSLQALAEDMHCKYYPHDQHEEGGRSELVKHNATANLKVRSAQKPADSGPSSGTERCSCEPQRQLLGMYPPDDQLFVLTRVVEHDSVHCTAAAAAAARSASVT
jgi:hypothetical protein